MKTHSMPSSRDHKPSARPRSLAAFALVAAGLCAAAAHASIVNPSFEDVYAYNHPNPMLQGFLLPVGWNVPDVPPGFDPFWWDEFGAIAVEGYGFSTPTDGMRIVFVTSRIWQTVTLTGGDQIVLDVAIDNSYGYFTYGCAGMSISNGQSTWSSVLEIPWDNRLGWPNNDTTGWQQITLTVPASGTYELTLWSALGGSGGGAALFDNIRVIPTPGAAALLGLSSVLVARRRRR
jgi:hypothetical protein